MHLDHRGIQDSLRHLASLLDAYFIIIYYLSIIESCLSNLSKFELRYVKAV